MDQPGELYGSGDGNPKDSRHGTFFQVLTTPRQYARFPFYNMMNNEDAYATLNLRPVSKLGLRSEVHAMRLAIRPTSGIRAGARFRPRPSDIRGVGVTTSAVWGMSGI